jgi:hypothetical protein
VGVRASRDQEKYKGMKTAIAGVVLAMAMAGASWAETAELRVKWEAGKAYTYEMDVDMAMEMPGLAGGQRTKVTQTVKTEVRAGEGVGHRVLSIEYTRITVEMAMMGQVMSFDSDDPASASPMLEGMFQPMLGSQMEVTLDADDKVIDFEGLEDGGQAPGMPTEEQIREMVTGTGDAMPEGAVEVGESWIVEQEMQMGEAGAVKVKTEYTLEAIEEEGGRKLARVVFDGTMEVGGEGAAVEISEGKMKDGEMLLDLGAAVMESSTLTIEMTMSAAGQEMPMVQKVAQRLVSVEDL